MRTGLVQSMSQALAKHEHTNYHIPSTDESWMFQADDHRTKWVASWDDVTEIQQPSHFHQKRMFTVFSMAQGNINYDSSRRRTGQ
jgi:hypothetical protein